MIRILLPAGLAAPLALLAAPVTAQTGPAAVPPAVAPAAAGAVPVAVGAAVSDQAGAPVGTIAQVTADAAVIDTGTIKAAVPLAAVGPGPNGGLVTTVTRIQLESAARQGAAQLKAMLVPGTAVNASDGTTGLGTVKAADDKLVTVTTEKGDIRLPVTAFGARDGKLVTSLTADQFAAAVSQSLPAEKSATTATTTKSTTTRTTKTRRR